LKSKYLYQNKFELTIINLGLPVPPPPDDQDSDSDTDLPLEIEEVPSYFFDSTQI